MDAVSATEENGVLTMGKTHLLLWRRWLAASVFPSSTVCMQSCGTALPMVWSQNTPVGLEHFQRVCGADASAPKGKTKQGYFQVCDIFSSRRSHRCLSSRRGFRANCYPSLSFGL